LVRNLEESLDSCIFGEDKDGDSDYIEGSNVMFIKK
jgi:hypothetical protein